MAETQNAPFIAPRSHHIDPYRRPPRVIQLPPLTVPGPTQNISPTGENLLSLSNYSFRPLPNLAPDQLPLATSSRRSQGFGPAAPLANLLSPATSTPRSDSPYSSLYDSRTSPHPSVESRTAIDDRPRRYLDEQRRAVDAKPDLRHGHTPEVATRLRRARIPSPAYAPTHASSDVLCQAPYQSAQTGADERSKFPAAAPGVSYGIPPTVAPADTQGVVGHKPPLQCELRIRQQPVAARACGFGERDRRVIDPPPILQLLVRDPHTGSVDMDELRYSLHIIHCTLWNAEGNAEETALRQPDRRTTRRLMGQLVASPSIAKDERDEEGCFFCFPDLSCRTHGRYRLRFILIRMDPANMNVGSSSPILSEVLSDVFTVYSAKDFPGMQPSSALTRALKLQGCNIQVKKGNERSQARKRKSFSDHDDGGESNDGGSRPKRPRDSP